MVRSKREREEKGEMRLSKASGENDGYRLFIPASSIKTTFAFNLSLGSKHRPWVFQH